MSHIEVIQPGMLSSVQDLGRHGHGHAGVPRSGAFDAIALRIGNRLLGNDESEAVIETTLIGGVYRFSVSSVVCLTGARAPDATVTLGDHSIVLPHDEPVEVPKNATIRLGRLRGGARAYLCVLGGILSPRILASRSALVSLPDAGLGTALRAGDQLPIQHGAPTFFEEPSASAHRPQCTIPCIQSPKVLRVVEGAHTARFNETQRNALGTSVFQVADQSNRAGVRLQASPVPGVLPERVPSEGTLPGYIQVPPSGDPIILGVDGPTTGGYPVIASVIQADLPVLAQCLPREAVRFEWISYEQAVQVLVTKNELVQAVKAIAPNPWGGATPDA